VRSLRAAATLAMPVPRRSAMRCRSTWILDVSRAWVTASTAAQRTSLEPCLLISVPEAELAVIVHNGSHDDLDRAYGALATYVGEHALAVDGLIREYYLIGPPDTDDESVWRTEIGWPIFDTARSAR
jgi:GyrI-like small molecule binding domain